jgi:hypothetical protein
MTEYRATLPQVKQGQALYALHERCDSGIHAHHAKKMKKGASSRAQHASHLPSVRHRLDVRMWLSVEDLKLHRSALVDPRKCALVSDLVTVIWRREDSRAEAIVLFCKPALPDFVTSQDCSDAIELAPLAGDVRSESETDTTLARTPSFGDLRVAP